MHWPLFWLTIVSLTALLGGLDAAFIDPDGLSNLSITKGLAPAGKANEINSSEASDKAEKSETSSRERSGTVGNDNRRPSTITPSSSPDLPRKSFIDFLTRKDSGQGSDATRSSSEKSSEPKRRSIISFLGRNKDNQEAAEALESGTTSPPAPQRKSIFSFKRDKDSSQKHSEKPISDFIFGRSDAKPGNMANSSDWDSKSSRSEGSDDENSRDSGFQNEPIPDDSIDAEIKDETTMFETDSRSASHEKGLLLSDEAFNEAISKTDSFVDVEHSCCRSYTEADPQSGDANSSSEMKAGSSSEYLQMNFYEEEDEYIFPPAKLADFEAWNIVSEKLELVVSSSPEIQQKVQCLSCKPPSSTDAKPVTSFTQILLAIGQNLFKKQTLESNESQDIEAEAEEHTGKDPSLTLEDFKKALGIFSSWTVLSDQQIRQSHEKHRLSRPADSKVIEKDVSRLNASISAFEKQICPLSLNKKSSAPIESASKAHAKCTAPISSQPSSLELAERVSFVLAHVCLNGGMEGEMIGYLQGYHYIVLYFVIKFQMAEAAPLALEFFKQIIHPLAFGSDDLSLVTREIDGDALSILNRFLDEARFQTASENAGELFSALNLHALSEMQINFIRGVLENLKDVPFTATAVPSCFMETFTDWHDLEKFMTFLIIELPVFLRRQTLSLLSATATLYLLCELDRLLLKTLTRPEWESVFELKSNDPSKYQKIMESLRLDLCPKLIDIFKKHIPSLLSDVTGFIDTARALIPYMVPSSP